MALLVEGYNNQIDEKNRELASYRDSEKRLAEMSGRLKALEEELANLRKSAENNDESALITGLMPPLKEAIEESMKSTLAKILEGRPLPAENREESVEKASPVSGKDEKTEKVAPKRDLLSDPIVREPGR